MKKANLNLLHSPMSFWPFFLHYTTPPTLRKVTPPPTALPLEACTTSPPPEYVMPPHTALPMEANTTPPNPEYKTPPPTALPIR